MSVRCSISLTTVEVIHQNVGNESSLRLQLSALSCDECGAIPWDELQVKTRVCISSTFRLNNT